MRIGLITTLNTNIGDDFIREGIIKIMDEIYKGRKVEYIPINKHNPYTIYPSWHPISWAPRGQRILRHALPKFGFTLFDKCDLIVQCGAPVLWSGCHRCEWAGPLWHEVIGRIHSRIPVINLAAGSCYPLEKKPDNINDPDDAEYLRSILDYCRLTTVRDTLAQQLFKSLNKHTPLIPCSAFLNSGKGDTSNKDNGVVLINYMSGGGHYDWNQEIDHSIWESTVKTLITRLEKRHKLALLCHNETEYQLAREITSSLPILWPKNTSDYLNLVSSANVALCNRMHASIVLAGLGIPSVAVCTDTRLLMVDAIGLPCMYVNEATVDKLEDVLENMLTNNRHEHERLLALRSDTWNKYIQAITVSILL